jgi:cytoskeletal protein RodZ
MPESIGQRLKQTREARYLTLERASEDTRIRVLFLQALEADDYSVIPSAAQGRGFLRNYAEYLELNIDEMIAEIQRNAPAPVEVSGPLPQVNLLETDIPPLVNEDEKPSPRFFNRWLGRRPKADSPAEIESPEPVLEEIPASIESEPTEIIAEPKTRGRKKKKVVGEILPPAEVTEIKPAEETLPVEAEQLPVKEEAKAGFISQLVESVQSLFKKKEAEPAPVEEAVEEEIKPEDVKPVVPTLPADVIFAEIGVQLRERRELISLTLDEVERHTHLRAVFLKALEDGAMDRLPSPVQTRGMLANYAAFLDLNTDTILLRFADVLQARRHEKYAETPREKIQTEVVTSMPLLRTFIAGDLVFGVVMIAILAALAIWGFGRLISSTNEQEVEATAPSIVEVLGDVPLPTASLQSTFVAVNDDPLATSPAGVDVLLSPEAPTEGVAANVSVSLFSLERTFVKVSVDGEVVFEGRMAPRETKIFDAENQVVVLTGNASALRVTYNGQDLGLMGGIGEVVSRVYLISGVVTPTATIPPTPTETPLETPTGTPTSTPTATPTVTPPDGG